jgi:Leucine-rich repeat
LLINPSQTPLLLQELASLPDLERLSLGGCKIRGSSLNNFPSLQNLSWLNLTDNAIADNLGSLTVLTNLKDLDLSGNRITDLSQLEPLTSLQQLSSIDVSGCPAEKKEPVSIRKSIFEMLAVLPALKYVNGEDLLGNGTLDNVNLNLNKVIVVSAVLLFFLFSHFIFFCSFFGIMKRNPLMMMMVVLKKRKTTRYVIMYILAHSRFESANTTSNLIYSNLF